MQNSHNRLNSQFIEVSFFNALKLSTEPKYYVEHHFVIVNNQFRVHETYLQSTRWVWLNMIYQGFNIKMSRRHQYYHYFHICILDTWVKSSIEFRIFQLNWMNLWFNENTLVISSLKAKLLNDLIIFPHK